VPAPVQGEGGSFAPAPAAPSSAGADVAGGPSSNGSVVPSPLFGITPEAEKVQLLQRLTQLFTTQNDSKVKWWSFCKVHGDGCFDPNKHDAAFLMTFLEALETGDVPEEPGCPFVAGPGAGAKTSAGAGLWASANAAAAASAAPQGGVVSNAMRVFVGGLPKSTTEDALRTHMSWYGPVSQIELKYDEVGGFRGFGFVTFQDAASAQKVIADKSNNQFQNRWIECKAAVTGLTGKGDGGKGDFGGKGDKGGKGGKGGKGDKGGKGGKGGKAGGGKSADGERCFIGALPRSATQATLTTFFSQFGPVLSVDLKMDQETGEPRGFGFVTFGSKEAMQAALNNSANNVVDGKWIDVKPAQQGDKGGGKGAPKGGGKAVAWTPHW